MWLNPKSPFVERHVKSLGKGGPEQKPVIIFIKSISTHGNALTDAFFRQMDSISRHC